MPKIVYFTVLSILVFAAVTAVNIIGVNAHEETRFVPVSVLAEDQANYGVDENVNTIPAISPAIIEDKVHDITLPESVKTIKYTTLPPRNPASSNEDNNPQTGNQSEGQNDQGNNGTDVSNQNNNNGNGTNNGNNSTNNNKDKGNNKDKNNNKDSGSSSGNNNKTNEKSDGSTSNKDSKSTQTK